MSEQHTLRSRPDRGFTLVELMIVVSIVGIISIALSNSIITVLRANAVVEKKLEGNGDLLFLPVWLPQDVNSTPESTIPGAGIETGNLPSQCAGTDPGVGLLRLTWSEQTTATNTDVFRVSYRAITNGSTTTIRRVICEDFGVPKTATVTHALQNFPDGTSPVTVTATISKVVFAVTQQPGTASQRIIRIEAVSKNPAVPTLGPEPPPPPPPTLTLSASSVNAGSSVIATVSGFGANEVITFSIDVTESTNPDANLGTVTTGPTGSATKSLLIPISVIRATHTIIASNADGDFDEADLFVNSATVTHSGADVMPGMPVQLILSGFTVGDTVTFLIDNNPIGSAQYTGSNQTVAVELPLGTTGGQHAIEVTGTDGRRAVSDPEVNVVGRLVLDPASMRTDSTASASIYGFRGSESITLRLDSATGPALSSAFPADATGQATGVTIAISTAGNHVVYAVGATSQATASVVVTAPVTAFNVTANPSSVTAGTSVTLTLEALIDGARDTAFAGTKAISITGVSASPNGTSPTLPTSAVFSAGVATVNVTLVKAESPTTIVVNHGSTHTGSTAVTVTAGALSAVAFSPACPNPNRLNQRRTWTSGASVTDSLGNPISGATVTLNFNPAVGSTASVASVVTDGWTTVTANRTFTSTTSQTGVTPSFTATGPNGNNSRPATTVTVSSGGKTATCQVTT